MPAFFEEDEKAVSKCIKQYLNDTNIDNWKTFDLIDKLLQSFIIKDVDSSIHVIKNLYTSCIGDFKKINDFKLSERKFKKVDIFFKSAAEFMDNPAIKIKFVTAFKKGVVEVEAEEDILESLLSRRKRQPEANDAGQTISTKRTRIETQDVLNSIFEKYGNDNVVDLATIPPKSEQGQFAKKLMKRHNLKLKFALSMDEHGLLNELASGDGIKALENMRDSLFQRPKAELTPHIEYLRTAINHLIFLYEERHLLMSDHNESFYQCHVYSILLDAIFLRDPNFKIMRSECNSTVYAKLKSMAELDAETKAKKWDMIYRHIDTKHDLFICEDKPQSACESSIVKDSLKCDELRVNMLRAAGDCALTKVFMDDLEAVTAQTHGLNIVIRGTKKFGDKFVHYTKATSSIPASISYRCAALSEFFMTIISLKRTIILNFVKLQVVTESVRTYKVKYLADSPSSSPEEVEETSENYDREAIQALMKARYEKHLEKTKRDMTDVCFGKDVLIGENKEMLELIAITKKSTTTNRNKDP